MYVYVCLFSDCEGQSIETTGDVTEAETYQAADVEVTQIHQCKWEHKGVLRECQKLVSYWHASQGNKMGVTSSWQYYGQIWGACASFAFTTVIKWQADKDQTGGSLFSLAIMSENSYATWTNNMYTFQINTLINFPIFDVFCMFQTSWVHSQDGLKHIEDIRN